VVSAINFEYRGFDTVGEEFILFVAAAGVATVLRRLRGERERSAAGEAAGRDVPPTSSAVRMVALLFTVQQPLVTNTFGLDIVIIALIGAVVGGIDRLWTATAGAFAAGFLTSVLASALPASQLPFQTAWLFLLLLIALLVRPAGLFAPLRARQVERV